MNVLYITSKINKYMNTVYSLFENNRIGDQDLGTKIASNIQSDTNVKISGHHYTLKN